MLDSDFIPSNISLPKSKIFYFDIEEKNSGSTTIYADISLPDLECFNFKREPEPGKLTSIVDSGIHENVLSETNVNLLPKNDHSSLFAYVNNFPLPVKKVATGRRKVKPMPGRLLLSKVKKKLSPKTQFYSVFVVSQGFSFYHSLRLLRVVIEFGDSYVVPTSPLSTTTTDTASGESGKMSGRMVTLTAEDMQKKKNDVKARTNPLLSLPDEHQLRFNKYKTTRELWASILKTFGGNEATKKTKKNLLKQQYGNFKAEGSETLDQTFNRLQVIVGQLPFMDVEIEQDDLNQKFLTKVQKKSKSNSKNMAFISLAKHSSRNEDGNTACVPTASASVATISQDTACAYISSQCSGSQIKFEDINQIDEDDMEEMDIK
nr:hypothetical protein [Tanacetum cinerariifolium]